MLNKYCVRPKNSDRMPEVPTFSTNNGTGDVHSG